MFVDKKTKYKAAAISILLHVMVFFLVASTGLFFKAIKPKDKTVVEIYDADVVAQAAKEMAGADGSGTLAADSIVLPEKTNLPKIMEEYTQVPEMQKVFREQQTTNAKTPTETSDTSGKGKASVAVNENSKGNGPGGGSGSGDVSGMRNGSGNEENGTGKAQGPKTRPKLLSTSPPIYPETLHQENIEGAVRLKLSISKEGNVESVDVVSSSGYMEMDQAASDAAYTYHFSPAFDGYGDAVRCMTTVTIKFKMK